MMKKLCLLPLSIISLLFFSGISNADTLTTPSYVITIIVKCEEGTTHCDNVRYVGVNRKSKKSISLKGRDLTHYCPDDQGDGPAKTPCHHMGYEFNNGKTKYFVSDEGRLEVRRGSKVLLEEHGVWCREFGVAGSCPTHPSSGTR
jgi:hypothetical protein